MGKGLSRAAEVWASPVHSEARFLLDHRLLRSCSLFLLETLLASGLQRCCLTPDPFLQEALKALPCSVDTDTSKQEFPADTGNLSKRTCFHLGL